MRGSRPEDQYGYVDEHGRYVRPGTESEAAPERARPAVGPSSQPGPGSRHDAVTSGSQPGPVPSAPGTGTEPRCVKRPGWVALLAALMIISGLGMMGWSSLNQHPVAELPPQKPTQQFFGHSTIELSADRTYNIYNRADWNDRTCYVADGSAIDPGEDATEVRRLPRDTDSGVVVRDREWRAVRTFQVTRTGIYTVWCETDYRVVVGEPQTMPDLAGHLRAEEDQAHAARIGARGCYLFLAGTILLLWDRAARHRRTLMREGRSQPGDRRRRFGRELLLAALGIGIFGWVSVCFLRWGLASWMTDRDLLPSAVFDQSVRLIFWPVPLALTGAIIWAVGRSAPGRSIRRQAATAAAQSSHDAPQHTPDQPYAPGGPPAAMTGSGGLLQHRVPTGAPVPPAPNPYLGSQSPLSEDSEWRWHPRFDPEAVLTEISRYIEANPENSLSSEDVHDYLSYRSAYPVPPGDAAFIVRSPEDASEVYTQYAPDLETWRALHQRHPELYNGPGVAYPGLEEAMDAVEETGRDRRRPGRKDDDGWSASRMTSEEALALLEGMEGAEELVGDPESPDYPFTTRIRKGQRWV